MRMRTWLMALGLVALCSARPGRAQDSKVDWNGAIPTSLLRVLAEGARDFRTGEPIWLVAWVKHPERVVGSYRSAEAAGRAARRMGPGYRRFGPYLTPRDSADPSAVTVDSVVLFLRSPGGKERVRLNPRVDALFLTRAAAEKFLIPYYAALYGPRYAAELEGLSIRPPCHIGGTIWCELPGLPRRGWAIDTVREH